MANANDTNPIKKLAAVSIETVAANGSHSPITAAPYLLVKFGLTGSELTVDVELLSPEIRHAAMMHGLKQKLVDAAAMSRNTATGQPASPEEKEEAVRIVHQNLMNGEWNRTRSAGEGGESGNGAGGLLFRALCRYQPAKSAADIRAFLDSKSKAEQAALRANPKIAAIIATIQSEGAKAKAVDSDALLESL